MESLQGLNHQRILILWTPDRSWSAEGVSQDLFNPHARCRGCGTGGSARAGPFTARAHGVMHEYILFTQIVDTDTFYLPKVFCTPSIVFTIKKNAEFSPPSTLPIPHTVNNVH